MVCAFRVLQYESRRGHDNACLWSFCRCRCCWRVAILTKGPRHTSLRFHDFFQMMMEQVRRVFPRSYFGDICRAASGLSNVLSCSTLVCEMTTHSLHSRIPRMQTDLLLRLNAIVRNPLPFWLKILETSFLLYCPGLLLLILRLLPRWLSFVRSPSTSFCVKAMR